VKDEFSLFISAEASFVPGLVAEQCRSNQNHQRYGVVVATKTITSSSCSTGRVQGRKITIDAVVTKIVPSVVQAWAHGR
jgi:hypothetical protein